MGIPLNRNRPFLPHPSDDVLEDYALGRLSEELVAAVEEHLLICRICQDSLAEADQFVAAIKGTNSQPAPWWRILPANGKSLAPILALVILALVMVWKHPQETSPPVAVSLSSPRGSKPLAAAPAGKPLRLAIELPDLKATNEYSVDVVDAAGSSIWKGAVSDIDGKLIAAMPRPLGSGVYWVRLYGRNSELLREFGLSAK